MIFPHKSDEAARQTGRERDRDWVIRRWGHTGSHLSRKARETNRFHSPRWFCLLSPVVLNGGKKRKKSSFSLHLSLCHPYTRFPLLSLLCVSVPLWMINAPHRPASAAAAAPTRLLLYHRWSDVAAFHGHLDTFHKSCKAEVKHGQSRAGAARGGKDQCSEVSFSSEGRWRPDTLFEMRRLNLCSDYSWKCVSENVM